MPCSGTGWLRQTRAMHGFGAPGVDSRPLSAPGCCLLARPWPMPVARWLRHLADHVLDDMLRGNCHRRTLSVVVPDLDMAIVESGGDNLAATFSPELVDLTIQITLGGFGAPLPVRRSAARRQSAPVRVGAALFRLGVQPRQALEVGNRLAGFEVAQAELPALDQELRAEHVADPTACGRARSGMGS